MVFNCFAKVRKRDEKLFLENHDRTLQRDKNSLKALGEHKNLERRDSTITGEGCKKTDLAPTSGPFVPSIYPHTELRKDDRVSRIWSALPGIESTDSDSSDEQCLRPTRT